MLTRALLLVAALTVGCAGTARVPYLPEPVTSDHFRTERAGFRFDVKTKVARYYVDYAVVEPFAEPVSARVTFENPLDPNQPFVVEKALDPAASELELESPSLPAIRNGGVYTVILTVHAPGSNAELARHAQGIRFVLPTMPR